MAPATDAAYQHRFDGERLRDVWRSEDGPGDGDVDLMKSGQDRKGGHPTWKIFVGDMSEGIKLDGVNPPLRVYLDDKACYEVMNSNVYSNNLKGKQWPYDFTGNGKIRARRPNRGRTAYFENGMVATGYTSSTGKPYYFYGEKGDPSLKRKPPATEPTAAHKGGGSPGPMDIVRMDEENYARAQASLNDSEEAGIAHVSKRRRPGDDLLSKPLDELDKAELEELRKEYIKTTNEVDDAHTRAAQLHHHFTRAEHHRAAITDERDQLLGKLKEMEAKLNTMHRENYELNLVLKRQDQEGKVTRLMLEKTKNELRQLKDEHAVLKIRAEAYGDEAVDKLRQEHGAVVVLCRTLHMGHAGSKAIIEDIRVESNEGLPDSLKSFDRTHMVVDGAIEDIKKEMAAKGFGNILDKLTTNVDLDDGEDAESEASKR